MTKPEPARIVVAVVPDLMDRSRLASAGLDVVAVAADALAATVTERRAAGDELRMVVVDLSRPGVLDAVEGLDPGCDVVGFAPHVDDALIARAQAAGVLALPRSRFFARWPDVI